MLPRFARPQNQEEEKLLEETQEHLKTYAEDGLRTLMTGIRYKIQSNSSCPINMYQITERGGVPRLVTGAQQSRHSSGEERQATDGLLQQPGE